MSAREKRKDYKALSLQRTADERRLETTQERERLDSGNGHGLGLSLAREIIHLHNGTLTLNSTLGTGSEFVIEFRKETALLKQAV